MSKGTKKNNKICSYFKNKIEIQKQLQEIQLSHAAKSLNKRSLILLSACPSKKEGRHSMLFMQRVHPRARKRIVFVGR